MSGGAAKKINVVLVGRGRMGANHFRVLEESPDFSLKAVIDQKLVDGPLPDRPAIPGFSSLETFARSGIAFDAAVVATATETHFSVASKLLEMGKPLLVEKPLASTEQQSTQLIALAKEKNLLLAVGHVERMNPAVVKLKEVIANGWLGDPIHISVTRVGGYPSSVQPGNNVLLDLAVHDLDVIRSLAGPIRVVSSVCHKTVQKDVYDTGEILLSSQSGASASIHVNWITPTKIRTIRVTGTRGVCFVDYMMQTCELFGGDLLKSPPNLGIDFASLVHQYQNSDKIVFGINKEEPLKVQLRAFRDALRGQPHRLCLGSDGAAAVRLAEEALRVPQNSTGLAFT